MQGIKGHQIGFVKTPIQKSLPHASVLSQDRKSILDREVFELQEKHVIHLVNQPLMEEGFVSSLFVVPKKGGGQEIPSFSVEREHAGVCLPPLWPCNSTQGRHLLGVLCA